MDDELDINELLQMEIELEGSDLSLERDAKVNLLKFLQVKTVKKYERAYDSLYYELNMDGGLECLHRIEELNPKSSLFQPEGLEPQGCDADENLGKQLDFYREGALRAKVQLDKLVRELVNGHQGRTGLYAEVKSLESTRRKATKSYGGDVRRLADMARVSVICDTPEDLELACKDLMESVEPHHVKRVRNGFNSGWKPSGYRDVKVNTVVSGHLCEIQLQLGSFFKLKDGQHEVYEWARELKVSTEMDADHLFKMWSPGITEEMVRLAQQNWRRTRFYLPDLLADAAQYVQAEEGYKERLSRAEAARRGIEDQENQQWRQELLVEASAACDLGVVLAQQGKYEDADALFVHVLRDLGATAGTEHPNYASVLNNRAGLLGIQGKFEEADPMYLESIKIGERTLGPNHPSLAVRLNNRAGLLESQGKYTEAEQLYERCMAIEEEVLGPEHPSLAATLNNLAELKQDICEQADPLNKRALAIWEKSLGSEHPQVATGLNNRAALLELQGEYDEARSLYRRAIEIGEKTLGPDHLDLAPRLNNLALLLKKQGEYEEADLLYLRAIAIGEKNLSLDNLDLATWRNNRALLLESHVNR
ncbi:kinesin light chain-like protein [Ectocarpus siliculosus]|uniref:Kinesin light chain-like protein n=1 Tax=Ectocarpus siliculosus TaxID=2880 RepID=D7FY64_ECTSI|nr:kinesin light chain-like protein [Ectocarpus siliculosus]|eukprot:CBJ26503.1 kinesin light chain-like protein [Ectocarpus siliculosus]